MDHILRSLSTGRVISLIRLPNGTERALRMGGRARLRLMPELRFNVSKEESATLEVHDVELIAIGSIPTPELHVCIDDSALERAMLALIDRDDEALRKCVPDMKRAIGILKALQPERPAFL
ncbi:MAG: hypothetical protein ABI574_00875 [Burkholderiales bacterium]